MYDVKQGGHMIKISIIMPLYNAARFLRETLESIKGQKFQEYELICINDGSEDHTIDIVEEYAKKDGRYVVLNNKKREGAAFSRNRGIEVARGEFLSFLDGDDIFDENMLELAYHKCTQEKLDIIIFSGMHVQSENINEKRTLVKTEEYKEKYCRKVFQIGELNPFETTSFSDRVCDRLLRRKFIIENEITFQDLPSNNDALFGTLSLYLAKRILILEDERVMVYARDHNTVSRISHYRDPMCVYYALNKLEEELIKRDVWKDYSKYFFYYCLQQINVAFPDTKDTKEEFVKYMVKYGIPNIIEKDRVEYSKQDRIIKVLFDKILKDKKKIDLPTSLIYERFPANRKYFLECKYNGKKIALWGAGKNGKAILYIFKAYELLFDYLIDSNKAREGELIEYINVNAPEEVADKVDAIIATNEIIYVDIKKMCEEKGIEVKNYFE